MKQITGQMELFQWMEQLQEEKKIDLKSRKNVLLPEIAKISRAKGEEYPIGTILIALSATKGQVEYLRKPQMVDPRWAVVSIISEDEPAYIYHNIQMAFPSFLHWAKTGINLQFEVLSELRLELHTHIPTQRFIVKMMELADEAVEREQKQIAVLTDIKKFYLDGMFC